jgi:PBP4 family serine-type D-alanyl-D-alanine carboxypeptidase
MKHSRSLIALSFTLTISSICATAQRPNAPLNSQVPKDIQSIFDKPPYKGGTWGLRVVDSDGKVLIDYNPQQAFYIGSVRKVFSVGELLNEIGPDHTYDTPVYRTGTIDSAGVLHGNLVLVASGDLTMGGRTNPDGTIAISDFDHNEADSLGNAVLTEPDPLAGYAELARQVAAAGIKKIDGDVVIDDRLFQSFDFRGQFKVTPIFVNDDVVDLTINPTAPAAAASVVHRPKSAAFSVDSTLVTSARGSQYSLELKPQLPQCIGSTGCTATVTGGLPANFTPPLTNKWPLVQTFRIVNPTNYARTVFMEKLEAAGVTVSSPAVAQNAASKLTARNSYEPAAMVAKLKGMPYAQDAKFILKVSYNIGADTSLVLFGLTQQVDNMKDALAVEQKNLTANYGVPAGQFTFVDGSGGGDTTATNLAVTQMLAALTRKPTSSIFRDALPSLGVDGSLGFVTDFERDTTLAPAKGRVHAKTGTFVEGSATGMMLKGQAFGGYIDTRSGKHLVYQLVVNNVPVSRLDDLLQVFQDEGSISAMLWRDN